MMDLLICRADRGLGTVTTVWAFGWGIRFGRPRFRLFSERCQGTRGIPRRYWYFFGGRLTVIRRRRLFLSKDSDG